MGNIPIPPNPIKVIRENHNLSQKAFASLAGVTENIVVRSELGMFPEMNPSIFSTLKVLEPNKDPLRILDEYELFILASLANVKMPYYPKKPELDSIDDMLHFRKALTEANDVSNTNYSMCKLLKVNIYPLDRFLKGRQDEAPSNIYERILRIKGLKKVLTEEDHGGGQRTSESAR